MSLQITYLSEHDRNRYEQFLVSLGVSTHVTFFHSWEWGELMSHESPHFVRIAVLDGDQIVAVGQLSLLADRKVPMIKWWYSPRGLAMDYSNLALVKQCYELLAKEFKSKQGAAFLRVDPTIVKNDPAEAVLDNLGVKNAPIFVQVERCWMAEIQPTEDEQFAWLKAHGMKSDVRRRYRKAPTEGVQYRVSNDLSDLAKFLDLLHQLDDRKQGIGIHPDQHYIDQFRIMGATEKELLFLAELNGEVISAHLMAVFGPEASWLHGAASYSEVARKLSPSVGLHIFTMRWLAEHRPEVKYYNFWGVISDENRATKTHPRHGYSEFKRQFGGYKLEYIRARDFVFNPILRKASYEMDALRTKRSQND